MRLRFLILVAVSAGASTLVGATHSAFGAASCLATLTLLDSTSIRNNTATSDGGGIYNNHGTLKIASTAVVTHNKPDNIVNAP
jgi:predicted outer membrane repeat protein